MTTRHTQSTQDRPVLVPIGKVACMAGVSVDTVRRWTDQGKLRAVRSLGGFRLYDPAHVRRVLEEAGLPVYELPA